MTYIWKRILCFFLKHEWNEIQREADIGAPYVTTLELPNGDTVNFIRQDFSAKRFCKHCQKNETHRGYDSKPLPGDKFTNAKKTASNSENDYWRDDGRGNLTKISEAEFLRLTKGKMPHE